MYGLNETNLIGRIGAEPEIRATNSAGSRCVTFSVATDESYQDKNRGEWVEKTEWHRVVSFMPGLVERIERLQKSGALKGKLVFVRGKNRTRSYKEGGETKDRYVTEILIDMNGKFQPLERISNGNGGGNGGGADANAGDASAPAPSPLPETGNEKPNL